MMEYESHQQWVTHLYKIGALDPEHEKCLYYQDCQVKQEDADGVA